MTRIYYSHEDEHHTTEFLTLAYEGCRALLELQKELSKELRKYVHISNIGLAFEEESIPRLFPSGRCTTIEQIRGYLRNPKYRKLIKKTAEAVHLSNKRLGVHGHD